MNKIEETKKSKVSNLIALTRIFEDYDDFKEKIEEYVAYNGKAGLSDLSLVSKANVVFLAFKAKKFYRENKAVIDEINAYSDIVSFAEEACTKDEAGNKTNCLDDFYEESDNYNDLIYGSINYIINTFSTDLKEMDFNMMLKRQIDELRSKSNNHKLNSNLKILKKSLNYKEYE